MACPPRAPGPGPARLPLLVLLLAGCAGAGEPPARQAARDGCGPERARYDDLAGLLSQPPEEDEGEEPDAMRQAFALELSAENTRLEALRRAFETLVHCRAEEARAVRAGRASGALSEEEAALRLGEVIHRAGQELGRARALLERLDIRAAERETAIGRLAGGAP